VTKGNIRELSATAVVPLLIDLLFERSDTMGTVQRRRECQSIRIDAKAVFHFGTWEPTVLATSHWPIPSVRCAPTLCFVDLDAAAERAISACGGDTRKTAKGLIVANDFLGLRSTEGGCIERLFSRSASAGPQAQGCPARRDPLLLLLFFRISP
jgi:hypothetical protein